MGNRAIVKPINSNIGVYLHWHGGIDSVRAFLTYCKLRDFRDFGGEFSDGYGIARFCQVVGNYLGGSLSMGVYDNIEETLEQSKYYDNGIYVIDGWDIVKHITEWCPDRREGYDITKMMCKIDERQPQEDRLGARFIYENSPFSEIIPKIGKRYKVDVKELYKYYEAFNSIGYIDDNTYDILNEKDEVVLHNGETAVIIEVCKKHNTVKLTCDEEIRDTSIVLTYEEFREIVNMQSKFT